MDATTTQTRAKTQPDPASPSRPRTRVFISYAQHDQGHSNAVLALAQALARDGIAVELDQFHSDEMQHWPRWCEKQLRPDHSDFVLMVCSAEYRRRIQNQVNRDEGCGVFWEAQLIYNALYVAKDNERYIPVLLDDEPKASIPDVMQGWTFFRLRGLGSGCADPGYLGLLRLLTKGDRQVERGPQGTHNIDLPAFAVGVPLADARLTLPALGEAAPVRKANAVPPSGINPGIHMQSNGHSAVPSEPTPHPAPPSADRHCDVLLLYVNDKERQAVVAAFTSEGKAPPPVRPQGLACLDLGVIDGRHILAMKTNMGSATPGGAAPKTQEAITRLNPEWIIAVGVAFGMDPDKTPIGTILISNRVSCYEPQRVGQDSAIQRGVSVPVDGKLHDFLHNVSTPPCWEGALIRFGEILSGEKLIDDPVFKAQLKQAYPEAIGGEMEAAGILVAAHTAGGAWIIVKAVCDFADGRKGRGKDTKQTRAAANAAQFLRYALGAYQQDAGGAGESLPEPEPEPEPSRRPAPLPGNTEQEIAKALGNSPRLCAALAKELRVGQDATPAAVARRLCAPATDAEAVLNAQYKALDALTHEVGVDVQEGEAIRDNARLVLGWTTVATVVAGYEDEELVKGQWFDGTVFRFPLGRNPCVEVLTARWRNGQAQFGTETAAAHCGEDDINPPAYPEDGVNPDDLSETPEVDRIYQRVFEKVHGKRPDRKLTRDLKDGLRETVSGMKKLGGPRLRLVIDDDDPAGPGPYASDQVLAAIHTELPDLYLIRVKAKLGGDPGVFILAPAVLTSRIIMILKAIKAIK